VILLVGVLIANRERVSKNVVVAIILIGGLAVLVGGVISASVGGRHFEKHQVKTEQGAPSVQPATSGTVTEAER